MRRFTGDRLVLASHNAGKLREIGTLLRPYNIQVQSAADFDLTEPDETETTFAGNARIKAHYAAKATGLPALSDDSGLTVDAINGRPGVYTADWCETENGRDYRIGMTQVWTELEAISAPEPRTAAFNCTLCLAWPDGHDEIFAGSVPGRIVWPMRGDHGFGYDPIFRPDGYDMTFGEMSPDQKNAINHRAAAFAKLVEGCFG